MQPEFEKSRRPYLKQSELGLADFLTGTVHERNPTLSHS